MFSFEFVLTLFLCDKCVLNKLYKIIRTTEMESNEVVNAMYEHIIDQPPTSVAS